MKRASIFDTNFMPPKNHTIAHLTMHRATAHTSCASIHSPPLTKRPSTLRSSATTKSNARSVTLMGGASSLAWVNTPEVDTDNCDGDDDDDEADDEADATPVTE